MPKEISTKELLQEGLGAYGQGNRTKAINSWQLVLELDPKNAEALDYLKSAGFEVPVQTHAKIIELAEHRSPSISSIPMPSPSLSVQLKELLKEHRYPEALTLLIHAKRNAPQDAAMGRAIQHVKDKYVVSLVKKLGQLDQRVKLTTPRNVLNELQLNEPSKFLIKQIDGEISIGDLTRVSIFEKYLTLEALSALCQRGLIRLERANFSLPPTTVGSAEQEIADELYAEKSNPITENRLNQNLTEPINVSSNEPTPAKEAQHFEDHFKAATLAYLQGDLHQALELFKECERLKPNDERVSHNIQRLQSTST